jgi:hypothetical protein
VVGHVARCKLGRPIGFEAMQRQLWSNLSLLVDKRQLAPELGPWTVDRASETKNAVAGKVILEQIWLMADTPAYVASSTNNEECRRHG